MTIKEMEPEGWLISKNDVWDAIASVKAELHDRPTSERKAGYAALNRLQEKLRRMSLWSWKQGVEDGDNG